MKAMGVKSITADQNQFKDMNSNISDDVDGCHQTHIVSQDIWMDCSMSQNKNSQPTNHLLDDSFKKKNCQGSGASSPDSP